MSKYQRHLHLIVVKNEVRGSNFSAVDRALQKHSQQHGTTQRQAHLPGLHKETMRKIDNLSFSFWGAENIKGKELDHLSLMERQRTKVWVKKAYQMLDIAFASLKAMK